MQNSNGVAQGGKFAASPGRANRYGMADRGTTFNVRSYICFLPAASADGVKLRRLTPKRTGHSC